MKRLIVVVPLGVLGALLLIGVGFLLGAGPLGKAVMRPTFSEREAIALVNKHLNDQIDSASGEIRKLQASGCSNLLPPSSSYSSSLNNMRPSVTNSQSAEYKDNGRWLIVGPERSKDDLPTEWNVFEGTGLVEPANDTAQKYLADIRYYPSQLSILYLRLCR